VFYAHVVNVCYACCKNPDVAHVAMNINACCKHLFQMFHRFFRCTSHFQVFQTYVENVAHVTSICCKILDLHIAHVAVGQLTWIHLPQECSCMHAGKGSGLYSVFALCGTCVADRSIRSKLPFGYLDASSPVNFVGLGFD
jgi:hypothetical protein